MQNRAISREMAKVGLKETKAIDAREIFDDVINPKRPINDKSRVAIEQLQDNRGILKKLGDYIVDKNVTEDSPDRFETVNTLFEQYKGVGIEVPIKIADKFQIEGPLAENPFLNDEEVNELKNLVYIAEQKLKFDEELKEKPVMVIDGNLKDIFGNKEPSEKELLRYTDTLKKWLTKEKCVPDLVVSDPDPRKFIFIFQGKGKTPELVEIEVKTSEDLDQLQKNLEKCGIEAKKMKQDVPGERSIIQGKDPFGVREGHAKKVVLEGFNKLSEDQRSKWDKFCGFLGIETEHVKQLKVNNQLAFTQLKINFNKLVKGDQSLKDIVSQLPENVTAKLESGERLTEKEVKQLQTLASRAMQKQRFEEDLRNKVPREIRGKLRTAFQGKTLENSVFERYLSKLKDTLISGGYPAFITSDVDPRKFLFFLNGQLIAVKVNSVNDLDVLQDRLKDCRNEALEWEAKNVIERLKSENEKAMKAQEKVNQKIVGMLDEKVMDREERNKELTAKLERRDEKIAEMERKNAELQQEIDKSKQANLELNKNVKDQDEKNKENTAKLDQLTKMLETKDIKIAEVERTNVEQQQKIDQSAQANQELKTDYEKQVRLLRENKNENEKLRQELTDLQAIAGNVAHQKEVLQDMQNELRDKEEALARNMKRGEELEIVFKNREKEFQEMEEKEDELLQRVDNATINLLFLGWRIGHQQQVEEGAEEAIERLRIEKETLQNEISNEV